MMMISLSLAGFSVTGNFGSSFVKQGWQGPNFDFTGQVLYRFDQMTYLGISSGMSQMGSDKRVPIAGSIFIRLPFGSQILPFGTGDLGYSSGNNKSMNGFTWRAGGGLDIKNGDKSSILITSGLQVLGKYQTEVYLRGGVLLEF